jgi:hypothetical protein
MENRELVDKYSVVFGNEIETQILAVAASLCRDVRRFGPSTATQGRCYTSAAGHGDVSPTASARAWDGLSASAQILASVSVWEWP